MTVLRALADAEERDADIRWRAADRLARVLAAWGRIEELRARADAGDEQATYWLIELLAEQGRIEELRARAHTGNRQAADRLANLLIEQGRTDEGLPVLRALAASSWLDDVRLADLLVDLGRIEELRARADAGDEAAGERLAEWLLHQDDIDQLWDEVHAGTPGAADALARWLEAHDHIEEAERIRSYGLNPDGSIAAAPAPNTGASEHPTQ
jgi:hypothetical protein